MPLWPVKKDRISKLPGELRESIACYIEKHYVDQAVFGAAKASRTVRCREMVEMAMPCCMAVPKELTLDDILKQEDAGFAETLLKRIDATGKKDSEIYKKANISKQHFSKIRNNKDYKPTKATAIALALALELDLEQTKDLIGRAGYALTNSSKFDLIIRYFIERRNYDVLEINMALYEFDQTLLGG